MKKQPECLTKEQQELVLQWYDYSVNVTRGWAAKHGAFWCINDLMSIAGLTLVRCVFRYSEKLSSGAKGFNTYLYASLLKNFRVTVFFAQGYKKIGRAAEWINPFNELEDYIFDNYVCSGEDEAYAEFDFDSILNSSRLLKETDKKILKLLYIQDMSMAEAARELNCTRENIRLRKVKALEVLKKVVIQEDLR